MHSRTGFSESGAWGVRRVGIVAVGVEKAIAQVLEHAPAELLRAGFGGKGNDAAAGASPLGRIGGGQHLDFLNGIHLGHIGDCVVVVKCDIGCTIEKTFRGRKFAAVDAECICIGLTLIVVTGFCAECSDTLGEVHELQRVLDIERRVLHELAFDDITPVRMVGDQFGGGGRNGNVLRLRKRCKRKIDGSRSADLQLHILDGHLGKGRRACVHHIVSRLRGGELK